MIDLKTLESYEHSSLLLGIADGAEVIRLAMRYLALREQFAPFSMDINGNHSWCWRGSPSRMTGETFDAAADKLIQEMLK